MLLPIQLLLSCVFLFVIKCLYFPLRKVFWYRHYDLVNLHYYHVIPFGILSHPSLHKGKGAKIFVFIITVDLTRQETFSKFCPRIHCYYCIFSLQTLDSDLFVTSKLKVIRTSFGMRVYGVHQNFLKKLRSRSLQH